MLRALVRDFIRDSGLSPLVFDILDVHIHPHDIHTDHLLDGACNLFLHVAPDLTDVDVVLDDHVEVANHDILMDRDADAFVHAAAEEAVHSARDGRHAADAWHAQGGHAGNRDQDLGSDSGLARRAVVFRHFSPCYIIAIPPSTPSTCPVMNAAWSDARNETAYAISSGLPLRPSGTIFTAASRVAGSMAFRISVSTKPGAIAFTVTLREATSRASDLVKPIMPA